MLQGRNLIPRHHHWSVPPKNVSSIHLNRLSTRVMEKKILEEISKRLVFI